MVYCVLFNFLCVGTGDAHLVNYIPVPMTLLHNTQYQNSYSKTMQQPHTTHIYSRSQSHPSSQHVVHQEYNPNDILQRPYSLTSCPIDDFVTIQGENICL